MMRPFLPLYEPDRSMFSSDEKFEAYKEYYEREMKRRRDQAAWDDAIMLVFVGIFVASGMGAAGFAVYLAGGWKGIASMAAGVGLIWAAVIGVHKLISREAR